MKRGRPTREGAQEIKQEILYYYEKDISPIVAARDLGVNPKTIYKHYKNLDKQRNELDDEHDILRIKNTKEKSIQSFDEDIIGLTRDIEKIKFLMEKSLQKGNISEFEKITKLKLKIMDERTKRVSAKINLVGTLTADVLVKHEGMIA
ncbi:hypothetical protein BD31_I1094 [Candidatus Nitrosopumilus salaria BD31]|uniref:Uncharacterized protein n=1 Tax=Candidatus Nitrosopumilus salarius BD31 TaxID=859350 RepID=I3D4M5_9ARCH|nr:hypothetical protein [Candidatus Nitrosopumilus salaria]EIJ66668.1 hypothetical protein BD31_I1094 [Candidatus Nitrosopumilus salaria BD31]